MKSYITASFLAFLLTAVSASAQEFSFKSVKRVPTLQIKKLSILRTTAASEKYKTLLAVMIATDLEELLDHSGPFTVFAPANLAFEKLSGTSLDDLMNPDNKKELKALMGYHIVAGKFSAAKILKALSRLGQDAISYSSTKLRADFLFRCLQGQLVMGNLILEKLRSCSNRTLSYCHKFHRNSAPSSFW